LKRGKKENKIEQKAKATSFFLRKMEENDGGMKKMHYLCTAVGESPACWGVPAER
jgi:hypothetical protein